MADETLIGEFLERPGMNQAKLARLLDVNQSAVSQMVAAGREIYIVETECSDGVNVSAYERRPVPARKSA